MPEETEEGQFSANRRGHSKYHVMGEKGAAGKESEHIYAEEEDAL